MKREDLLAPEKYNIVMEFEKYASDPKKVAIKWENENGDTREITYRQLIQNANRIGNAFLSRGLKKGDIILVMTPRLIEAYEIYTAALKTGLVVVPCSEMLRTKDLNYRIEHGDVKPLFLIIPLSGNLKKQRSL